MKRTSKQTAQQNVNVPTAMGSSICRSSSDDEIFLRNEIITLSKPIVRMMKII